jgi:hypothetical protein
LVGETVRGRKWVGEMIGRSGKVGKTLGWTAQLSETADGRNWTEKTLGGAEEMGQSVRERG